MEGIQRIFSQTRNTCLELFLAIVKKDLMTMMRKILISSCLGRRPSWTGKMNLIGLHYVAVFVRFWCSTWFTRKNVRLEPVRAAMFLSKFKTMYPYGNSYTKMNLRKGLSAFSNWRTYQPVVCPKIAPRSPELVHKESSAFAQEIFFSCAQAYLRALICFVPTLRPATTWFFASDGTLLFTWIELNTKNATKQQHSCRLVEFLGFNGPSANKLTNTDGVHFYQLSIVMLKSWWHDDFTIGHRLWKTHYEMKASTWQ